VTVVEGYGPTKSVLDELIATLSDIERAAILGETAVETYGLGIDKGRMYTRETAQRARVNASRPANTSDLTTRGIS
jgi:hypothetical protein